MSAEIPVKLSIKGASEVKDQLEELKGAIIGIFALGEVTKIAKDSVEAFAKLTEQSNKLAVSLGHQSKSLLEYAESQSKKSTHTKTEIIEGEKVLSQYTKNEATIKKLVPAMLNLAQRTGDISSAARLLGVSYEKGTDVLSKYGINVKGAAGSHDRLNSAIDQTNAVLGDQEQAAFDAMSPFAKMGKTFEEISVSLGKELTPKLNEIAGFFKDHQETFVKFATFMADNIEYFAFTAIALGVAKAAPIIVEQIKMVSMALTKTPWGAIALALGLLAAGFIKYQEDMAVYNKANDASAKDKAFREKLNGDIESVNQLNGEIYRLSKIKNPTKAITDEMHILKIQVEDTKKEIKELMTGVSEDSKKVKINPPKAKDDAALKAEKAAQKELEKMKRDGIAKAGELREAEYEKIRKQDADAKKSQREADEVLIKLEYQDKMKGWDILAKSQTKQLQKTAKGRKQILIEEQNYEFGLALKTGQNLTVLDKQQSEERIALARKEMEMKTEFYASVGSEALDSLKTIAEASHASADVQKGIAIGQAIINTAVGFTKDLSTFPGPLGIIMGALTIAAGAAQIALISQQKMAYGGVVTGGVQGQDSVPAMLMPGEIVYNPQHPNPALSSMINNATTNTTSNNMHVYGPTITINGNPSQKTIGQIAQITQVHIDRGVKQAIRNMQNSGKLAGITMHN